MKKLIAPLMFCFFALHGNNPKSSQTYLFTRPGQQNLCLMQAMWHNLIYDTTKKAAVDLAVYHQKSTHADKIKAYFLPAYQEEMLVNSTAPNRNIVPFWLQLPSDFNGILRIAPEQTQTGFTIAGRNDIGNLFGDRFKIAGVPLFQNWSVIWSVSFLAVKNNWGLTQSDVQNAGYSGTSPVYDILSAFNNPEWIFYRSNGPTHQNSISEVRIGLNTMFLSTERAQLASYSSLLVPCRKNPSLKYIFDAQNGYGHVGLVWGAILHFPLTRKDDDFLLAGTINFENIYLIRNHQFRTFDLYNKQWSRFMLLRKQGDPTDTLIPGVNILTHKVRVSPHNIMDFSTGFRLTVGCVEGEVGFGVWGNKGERCRFSDDSWVPHYGIAGTLPNTSASKSTIANIAPNDPAFVTILASDINMDSGAQTASVAYKAYGSLGFKKIGQKYDAMFSVGGEAEFPHNPTDVLSTWGIWISTGGAF